ncbi:uncharacterized protein LOC122266958 [Penaeus japonicus]|uniref:uncharacterized protein LOC122266958 n=1 Tax=Penaeus japonicus TaxID=27405 RepID=UPI001C712049|nr:uncharacterized protein LOC122266958 [Penaeus japonicus]
MTSVQHFNDGTDLEVRWRTSSEQTFSISIEEDVSGDFTKTSITCGREIRTCKAYFTKLSTGTVHWVKVTKDKTAVSISVSPHQDTTTPLSIARISKVSTVGGQVQLTISSDTEVEGAKYLEYVVLEPLAGSESVQHIAFADFNDVIHAGNVITFEDVEAPKTNVEVTVMVIAHSDDGVDSDALAFGKALVTFEEIKLPQMTKVGTESFQSLKVETSAMTVKVNGFTCPASTVCYYLEPENIKEPPEVCRMANPTVEQCDMTAMYIVPEVLVDPSVQLSYTGAAEEDLIVAAEFSDTSIRMEAKLYTDTEVLTPKPLACEITGHSPKTCTFKVDPKVTEFKILLMALRADSIVTKSSVVEFEDFQTRIQEMTTGTIDVTWRASDKQYFDIEIFPEIEGSFSSSTVECGGDDPEDISRCSAFFFALELNKDYTASVRVRGDHRSVSAAVKLEPILETINITELILSKTGDARTDLNVCFMEDQQAGNKDTQKEEENLYRLVAVDANGRQLWMTSNPSLSSVSVVEDKLCLGPLPLDLDFDLSDKVWILVTRGEDAAGDVEVFPLDPREVEVKQVGKGTLRARWTNSNKAPSFEVGTSSDDLSSVECGAGEEAERECLRYLHVENTNTPVTVTLREIGLSVQQEVQVELTLEDLPDIIITETELTLDNRLRVCFESHSEDSLYLLALENAEGDVQEASQLLPSQEDGLTCVLTNDAVQAEGYVSLWTLLAAFNDSGALQASGNTDVSDFFLSARRSVGAAWNTDTHDLLVSWFLLSDPKTISSYHVALEETTAGGGNDPIKVGNDKSSYVFKNKTGRYSVCVAAYVKENDSTSHEVCSAILSLPQSPVTVPEIGETTLKSAAPNKVLVTWQKPQEDADVSSYVITWRTDISSRSSSSSSSSSSNPARSLPQPLGLIQAANPVSDDDDLAFRVIPASTSSIEVEVEASQKYEMCVSSVKSDVMGKQTCNKVDQGNYAQLDQPKDLVFENEALSWAEVPTAEYYLVEWRPRNAGGLSEGGSQEVTSTTWPTQDLSPGTWMVEVRAALGSSVSDSTGIEIRKDGIRIVQAMQTSNSVLELSWWEEPVPSCAQTPCTYIITLNNGREQQHLCSGLQGDCTKSLNGVQGPEGNVTVTRDTPSTIGWRIYDFKAVGEVRQTFAPGAEEVTLSWAEMEGAKKYNVTLFADEALSSVRHTEMLSKETCTLAKSNMTGNVFRVQPCADDQHCGDALKVTLRETSVDQPPGDNLAFIISISVVGGLLAVILVASLVVVALKKNIENKKRKENSPQQQEFEMTYPVYNEWGARPLGRRAQWPPQSPYRK